MRTARSLTVSHCKEKNWKKSRTPPPKLRTPPEKNHACPPKKLCTPPPEKITHAPPKIMHATPLKKSRTPPPDNHAHHPPMWTEFLTHAYENITLPQTSFAGGNKCLYDRAKDKNYGYEAKVRNQPFLSHLFVAAFFILPVVVALGVASANSASVKS